MKILFVNHSSSLTGAPISCYSLMTGLGKGFEPVFASGEGGPMVDRLSGMGIKTYTVREKGFLGLTYIAEFLKIIKAEKIDLIHLNTLTPFCKYAGIAGYIRNVKVLWVIREDPLISRSRRLKFWLKKLSSKIVFVDRDTREKLLSGIHQDVEIVYNGVDTEAFKPLKSAYLTRMFNLEGGQKLIGYIGSITQRKGIDCLIRAMPAVKAKYQNSRLILIGELRSDENGYISYVRTLIKELSLEKYVLFTGLLPDVRDALNNLDIVVLASLDERCSRTLLEALACGKAVVATRAGGTPEIIEDGKNGYLVDPGDEKQFSESILRILNDDGLRQKMGGRGRRIAVNKFDIRNNINSMRSLYRELKHGH